MPRLNNSNFIKERFDAVKPHSIDELAIDEFILKLLRYTKSPKKIEITTQKSTPTLIYSIMT